jgi:hypothetical protein
MKREKHIARFLKHCFQIQEHGHCRNGPEYLAVKDVEIAVRNLEQTWKRKLPTNNDR